jgi:hypothetical protein
MNRNLKIAAAVAAVLGAGSANATPTLAQAQSPFAAFYISGSSAAKNGILGALENDICGGSSNALVFSSTGNTNFFAVSCAPSSSTGISGANGTNVFTMYYRDEGGSVVGALPLVSGSPISQLNLSGASCAGNACTVAVGGTSAANGTTDTFTGVTKQVSQLGVTDVEPGALVGDNYPTAYSTSAYGSATPTQLAGLSGSAVFQQTFGIFVNSSGLHTPICLSSSAVQGILNGNLTNWQNVEDCATHATVASASVPIVLVNREPGSGSRTATSIFWLDDECNPSHSGVLEDQSIDYFSTGNVLAAAAAQAGGVTYASIDQSQAGLVQAAIDGVTPSNLATAQGQYEWWVESWLLTPNVPLTGVPASIAAFLLTDLQNGNTAPHSAQVTLIPGSGSNTTPALPAATTANTCSNGNACTVKTSTAIYVNPFTRAGVTCSQPISAL